jgi:hypothetical protein
MDLVREIPQADMPTATNVLSGAPPSLLEALRVFWIGAAAGLVQGNVRNRSMMIHPSQRTLPHAVRLVKCSGPTVVMNFGPGLVG